MSANQWLGQLKSRGVKQDELTYTLLDDYLKANPSQSFTKRELQDWMRDNRIQVQEVVKENKEAVNNWEEVVGDDTKFNQYQLPGDKSDYKEVLITLPIRSDYAKSVSKDYYATVKEHEAYREQKVPREQGEDIVAYLDRSNATLAGDTKYQELRAKADDLNTKMLATDKTQGEKFRSGHFDEPNILAHLRTNIRQISGDPYVPSYGKKVLFIEEIQSDWAQKGKKEGFTSELKEQAIKEVGEAAKNTQDISKRQTGLMNEMHKAGLPNLTDYKSAEEYKPIFNTWLENNPDWADKYLKLQKESWAANGRLTDATDKVRHINEQGYPPAPFVTETPMWVKLGLKTALKQAVAQSADKLVWTTGEQQNERYDLSKQVDGIGWDSYENKKYVTLKGLKGVSNQDLELSVDKNSGIVTTTDIGAPAEWKGRKLGDVIGKEVAAKIMQEDKGNLSGEGLKVGGTGMIGFYGSPSEGKLGIVGEVAESMWGKGSVKTTDIKINDRVDKERKFDNHLDLLRFEKELQANKDVTAVFEFTDKDGKNGLEWKELTGTKQHSIDITPKMREEVGQGLPLFQKPMDFKGVEDRRVNQKSFEILLDKIKSQFDQLNFVKETSESLSSKGVTGSIRGYTDTEGIHYNLDKITTSTGVHELQHVWNAVAKLREPEQYSKFETYVSDSIKRGGNDISRLSEEIGLKYPELNKDQHIDEVMATIGGFTSVPAVERFLRESESRIPENDKGFAQRIYDSVKRFVSNLWDGIKSALGLSAGFDTGNPDLDKFYKDFTDQIFHGDKFKFSPDELATINKMGKAEQRSDKPILDISDITLYLASEYRDSLKFSRLSGEEVTDEIFKQMKDRGVNASGDYVYMDGKIYKNLSKEKYPTDEDLKDYISKTITPQYIMIDKKVSSLFKQFILYTNSALAKEDSQKGRAKTAIDIAGGILGEDYSPDVINKMVALSGILNGAVDAVRYSELTDSKDERIRGLFKEGMLGYDPIVVIHGFGTDGRPDVSLLDITSYGQGQDAVIGKQGNILGDIMNDKAYRKAGGPEGWNDKLYSYRKLLLGMQALGMDAKFRRLSVLEVKKDTVKPYQVNDIKDVQKILDIMKGQKELMDNVGDNTIRGIISSKRVDGNDFGVPFVEQLQHHLQVVKEATADLTDFDAHARSIQAKAHDFMDPNYSKQDMIKALTNWQRELQAEIKSPEAFHSDPIYQMVSSTLNELKRPSTGNGVLNGADDLSDIRGGHLFYETPTYLQRSNFIQPMVMAMNRSIALTLSRYKEYHEKVLPLLKKVSSDWQMHHMGDAATSMVSDAGNLFFDHLYKTIDVVAGTELTYKGKKYAKGETVTVRSPILHTDANDPETKRANLTKDDLALNNLVLEEMKQRTIDDIYLSHIFHESDSGRDDIDSPPYTRQMAEQQFNDMYGRAVPGHVPTMEMSANNLMMSGKFKAGFEKYMETVQKPEEIFSDMVSDKGITTLFRSLSQQMKDPASTYEKMGLAIVNDGTTSHVELFDPKANENASHNLERTANYFMLKSIRDEFIGKEFLPEYNTQMALMTAWEVSNDSKLPQQRDFINQYFNRYVNRENADKKMNAGGVELSGGIKVDTPTAARAAMVGMTGIILGGRLITTAKVGIGGEFKLVLNAIANSAATLGLSPEQRDKLLPTFADWGKSTAFMFTQPRKILALARDFQLWNESEGVLMKGATKNVSLSKHALSRSILLMPESTIDQSLRIHSLVSLLIHNGGWNAYSVDKNTGHIAWDRYADRRYFNADKSQSDEQRTLYNSLIDRMKSSGEMKEDETVPPRGDDWDMIKNQYNWYANQFAYPGIDDATKTIMGNNWYGSMLFMFKQFLLPHMYNIGVGAKTFDYSVGGTYKPVQDPKTGEWITILEKRTMEGQYQSWKKAINDLMEAKSKSPAEFATWWKQQPNVRRVNLARSMLYAGALAGLIFWISGMTKRDEERFSYYYAELMLGYSSEEWMKNPIPMINTTLKVTQVALGQKNFSTISSMPGPVGFAKRMEKTLGE